MKIQSLKDFIKSPVAITPEASSVLMTCCLSNKFDRDDPELDEIPIVKIVKNNASRRGLTITNGAALLIALTCNGNAGSAISMLHAMNLQRLRRDENSGADVLTMIGHDDFVQAFPMGVASYADYERWWDNGGKEITNSVDPDVWPLLPVKAATQEA